MKRRIFVLTLSLLIVLTMGTLAWMDNELPAEGRGVLLGYGDGTDYNIGIESNDLYTEFYVKNDAGEYECKFKGDKNSTDKAFFEVNNMKPSDTIEFKFVFKNNGTSNIYAAISFGNITAEEKDINAELGMPKLADAFYISLTGSEGYSEFSLDRPETTFERLSDIMSANIDDSGSAVWDMPFSDNITIPPINAEAGQGEITIYGYLLFDRNSTNEYENCTFNVGSILISM